MMKQSHVEHLMPNLLPVLRKSRFIPAVALLVPLLLTPASVWAANKLAKIEFTPSSTVTDIQLHSDSTLPYHITHTSDSKLMIDLDNVTNNGSIDTQFMGISEYSTISSVVLQPLNDHSLRIIVRGEHLAPPHIGFIPLGAETTSNAPAKTQANTQLIPESFGEDVALDANKAMPETHQAPKKPKINQAGIAQDMEATLPATELDVRKPSQQDPFQMPTVQAFSDNFKSFPYTEWIPYGIAGILFLGLGVFLTAKIKQLSKQRMASFDNLMAQQSQGQAVGFRQLANAYREEQGYAPADNQLQDNMPANEMPRYQQPQEPMRQAPARQENVKGDSLIGLGRLSQLLDSMQAQNTPKAPANSSKALNQRPPQAQDRPRQEVQRQEPAMPKAPAKAPIRQAASQYAQSDRQSQLAKAKRPSTPAQGNSAQNMAKQQAPAKPAMNEEQIRQELKRAAEAQLETRQQLQSQDANAGRAGLNAQRQALQQRQGNQQPSMRSGAAKNQAPLQGNQEVLNFLKNVADLMEKDGRPNMAQSFRSKAKPE